MTRHRFLLWSPRLLGVVVSVFLALFALDAFESNKPLTQALPDFAVHLVPAAVVLAIVALSWRRPWVGGVAFVLLAAAYALTARSRVDWIVVIAGPLLATGMLFLWSWNHQRV